jgi:hypothetical protein
MQLTAICSGPMKACCFSEWILHHDGRGVQGKQLSGPQGGRQLPVAAGTPAGAEIVVPIEWHEEDAEPVRVAVVQIGPKKDKKSEESGNP